MFDLCLEVQKFVSICETIQSKTAAGYHEAMTSASRRER